jgi:hypothetical protein
MCSPAAVARRWRTATELGRFDVSVKSWYAHRTKRDPKGQHLSQTTVVRDELLTACDRIRTEASAQSASALEAYERCARCDRALGWLRRVFSFFRDKFDQRDDPLLAPALTAADEVVWSCHRPLALITGSRDPSPLPYFDSQYSPAGVRRDTSLDAVVDRGSGFEFLRDYFSTLPMAVLRLPLAAANEPWMLSMIGHETGHFAQTLVETREAVDFGEIIAVAAAACGKEADGETWRGCAGEIFADWYSVAAFGRWALWSMAQFELAEVRKRRVTALYPSAMARLALLRELVDQASPATTPGTAMMATLGVEVPAPDNDAQQRDLRIAIAVARHLHAWASEKTGAPQAFLQFRSEDYDDGGVVDRWAKVLSGGADAAPQQQIETARQLAAASAAAWSRLETAGDDARDELAAGGKRRAYAKIMESATEGVRGVAGAVVHERPGAALAARLLSLDLPEESAAP